MLIAGSVIGIFIQGILKMKEKFGKFVQAAKSAASKAAITVGDLNGDGKVDEEDAKIAAEWSKKQAITVGGAVVDAGKTVASSGIAKDVASGAAVGAVIAIPVPVIGPAFGAVVGGGMAAYKNLTSKTPMSYAPPAEKTDKFDELLKLQTLREKGTVTEEEFLSEKHRIIEGTK